MAISLADGLCPVEAGSTGALGALGGGFDQVEPALGALGGGFE